MSPAQQSRRGRWDLCPMARLRGPTEHGPHESAESPMMRSWLWTCIRLHMACALLAGGPAAAVETKNVLVLYSNGRLVPGNVDVERGLHGTLESSAARPVHVFTEFLDSPDFFGERYEHTLTAYLSDKYASRPPQVIVAVARDALDYVMRHRATLFPRATVVHAAVFVPFPGPAAPLPAGVVGVPVDYDILGTMEQA